MIYKKINYIFLLIFAIHTLSSYKKTLHLQKVKDFSHAYELRPDFLRSMIDLFGVDIFIETGTYCGQSTARAADLFRQVRSVEIDAALQEKNKELFKNTQHVFLYTGDSVKLLPTMIEDAGRGKILYWIDAHWAEKEPVLRYPIVHELEIIAQHQENNPVILIDDVRDFDIYGQGIISVKKVMSAIKRLFPTYCCYIYGDVIIAFCKNEPVDVSPFIKAITKHKLNINSKEHEAVIALGSELDRQALEDIATVLPNTQHCAYWINLIDSKKNT